METLFIAIRILILATAAPSYVDSCDDDLCNVIDPQGNVRTVPRVALPKCAHESVWTYAGHCVGFDAPAFAPGLPFMVVKSIDGNRAMLHVYTCGFVGDDGQPEADYEVPTSLDDLPACARHVGALTACESLSPVTRATDDGADIKL